MGWYWESLKTVRPVKVKSMKVKKRRVSVKGRVYVSTQHCLRDVLKMIQLCGLFPLDNVASYDSKEMEFRWWSWKLLFTLCLFVGFSICCATAVLKAFSNGAVLIQLISPLFYVHVTGSTILFVKLSRKWRHFIRKCDSVDRLFVKKYAEEKDLRRTVNITALVSYFIVIVEHSLATVNFIVSTNCQNQFTGWEYYFRKQFHFIFYYFDYNILGGFFLLIISWIATFIWNFGDTFIILMSIIMSSRFHCITERVRRYLRTNSTISQEDGTSYIKVYSYSDKENLLFWRSIREDYDLLSKLCHDLSILLSDIVVLCYACNLSFILIQLFISLRSMESTAERVYFYYSFGFVIARTVAVSMYGGFLNEESQRTNVLLNSVSTDLYNDEIRRLILQIHVDTPCLTGHNFFTITKGLVLSVSAAIITYELVLIQFSQTKFEEPEVFGNISICY